MDRFFFLSENKKIKIIVWLRLKYYSTYNALFLRKRGICATSICNFPIKGEISIELFYYQQFQRFFIKDSPNIGQIFCIGLHLKIA